MRHFQQLLHRTGVVSLHGKVFGPEYRSWDAMLTRCLNKKHEQYKDYGGKGVTVCDRWTCFKNFFEDMGVRPKGSNLDRIDTTKGYYKENCRWATWKQQNRNRTNNRLITYQGYTCCLAEMEERIGFPRATISNRLRAGWTEFEACSTPLNSKRRAFK